MTGLTAGICLCNSACAGRGHAHKLERAFTEAPIASRRLSRQTKGKAEAQKGRAAVRLTKLRLPGGAPADGAGRQSRSRPLAGGRPKLAARRPEGRQTWLEATDLKCRWPEDQAGSRPRDLAVRPTRRRPHESQPPRPGRPPLPDQGRWSNEAKRARLWVLAGVCPRAE